MIERQRYSSGTKWETIVGYSRAVRVGNRIYVTGTTATDNEGKVVGIGDVYAQAIQAVKNIEKALKALGAELHHVVRTRMFVTDISRWQEIGRAHGEFFADIMPATSMIEVSKPKREDLIFELPPLLFGLFSCSAFVLNFIWKHYSPYKKSKWEYPMTFKRKDKD